MFLGQRSADESLTQYKFIIRNSAYINEHEPWQFKTSIFIFYRRLSREDVQNIIPQNIIPRLPSINCIQFYIPYCRDTNSLIANPFLYFPHLMSFGDYI